MLVNKKAQADTQEDGTSQYLKVDRKKRSYCVSDDPIWADA